MRTLYHLWLDPFCRKVRLVLYEKGLEVELRSEKVWERRDGFLALNPAGEVPVLVEPDGAAVCGSLAISEFLDESYDKNALLGEDPRERAEVRRLVAWFDVKFHKEVTRNIVEQKITKRMLGQGHPDSGALRAGATNIHTHLNYIAWLSERRSWLAGDRFSLADLAAAAHLSCVDYCGDVPWDGHLEAKNWYARIKSRPSFRPLLADHIPGTTPPKHYADLDF